MAARAYKNTKRISGSQSETPRISINNGVVNMSGYQKFTLTQNSVKPESYAPKFKFIENFIKREHGACKSLADLGCSNGMVCFMANQIGYEKVYALDHDLECINVIKRAKQALNFNNIIEKQYSFGDELEPVDVIIMGALIHWIYSCTALYGSFDKIIEYLRQRTGKVLLIEWVDSQDVAIKSFKHTKFNHSIIKEPYTRENFLKSLRKHFKSVEKVFTVRNTRELFMARV